MIVSVASYCLHLQLLVRAAYQGALAHPLIPDPDNLQHLTPEALAEFVAANYTGKESYGFTCLNMWCQGLHVSAKKPFGPQGRSGATRGLLETAVAPGNCLMV